MPESWNAPSSSFSSAISRSPWKTRTLTEVWLSAAVVNTFDSSVGIVVFFSMSRSKRPPFTSIPSERGHVQQDDVVDVAGEHAALNRRAERDRLVGVDVLLRLLSDERFDLLLNLRHPGGAADEDDLVDVRLE